MKFFVNGVLKFARGLKWALVGLSEYPGLHFLHRPADALGEYISNYDLAIERAERAKQQVETTKAEVGELAHMKHKHEGEGDAHKPPTEQHAEAEGPGTLMPPKLGAKPKAATPPAKPPGSSSDVHGTLMLDNFMQGANVPPDVREKWLQAAANSPQGAEKSGSGSFSGTLMMGSAPTMAPSPEKPEAASRALPESYPPTHGSAVATPSEHPDATVAEARVGRQEPSTRPAYESGYSASPYQPPLERPTSPSPQEAYREPEPVGAARWSEPAGIGPARVERGARTVDVGPSAVAAYAPSPTQPAIAYREAQPASADVPAEDERAYDWSTTSTVAATIEEDQPALIPLAQRQQQLARLEYVCQRLRELRRPLCPANGALTVLPMQTILAGPREMVELQKAVKADLAAIQNQLKLRFPVTALAVGLEEDPGFEEMVRRVGPERARSQRFGHRFDVRSVPTPSQLSALSVRISGVFEDWVYAIYRERGAIARRGNSHLFGLLCKVRTLLQERLMRVLCGGFGHDPEQATREEPIAFSGCYFAATGRSEDRRAFVAGVFDKLNEEQDNVEWTRQALREDRRFRRAGWFALGLIAIAAVALLIEVVVRRL